MNEQESLDLPRDASHHLLLISCMWACRHMCIPGDREGEATPSSPHKKWYKNIS